MKINSDYHTHTIFSHGKGTIEDNVKVAIEKGLEEIAISDHGPGHVFFGIKKSKYKNMREEIDKLNIKYPQINILLSIEANFMSKDGTIDVDEEMFEMSDMIMCGYHFGSRLINGFSDFKMHFYAISSKYSVKMYAKSKKLNTEMMINAMHKNKINAITHPGAKGPIDITMVAEFAASKEVLLEVNSKHGHLTVEEIKEALKTNVKFIIGSDAHVSSRVGECDLGIQRCIEAGVPIDRIFNVK